MYRPLLLYLLLAIGSAYAVEQTFMRVKIIHGYYGLTDPVNVTIYQDEIVFKQLLNIPYKGSSEWTYLPWGKYYIVVESGSQMVLDTTQDLTSYVSVYMFICDLNGPSLSIIPDDVETRAEPGLATLYFLNFIESGPALDFGIGSETKELASNLVRDLFTGPQFVAPLSFTIDVRPVDSTLSPFLSATLSFEADRKYIVMAVGVFGQQPPPELVVIETSDYSINSRLSFVHAIPDAETRLYLHLDDVPTIDETLYTNTTVYINIPMGTHVIKIWDQTENVIITATAFFNGFSEYSFYATIAGQEPSSILLIDDNRAPANGQARVRVVHGAIAGTVDILVDGAKVIPVLGYGIASEYLPVPAGTYSVSVNAANTLNSVFTVDLPVPAGPVVTVVAIGVPQTAGPTGFTVLVIANALYGTKGNVRAVHAIAGGPSVNVKAGATPLFSDVSYKTISDYLTVDPGLYRIIINNASAEGAELFRTAVRVDAGGYFTAVAGGVQALNSFAIFQLRDDNSRPAPTTAHVRVVHASASSPRIGLEFGGSFVGSLKYTNVFGYTPVPAGEYVATLLDGIRPVLNGTLVLEADTVVSVFAMGGIDDPKNGFTVPVIDFDYRTSEVPTSVSAPTAPTDPVATPIAPTPIRTPRTSSANVVTASVALIGLVALF